jgi:hypothetical protein
MNRLEYNVDSHWTGHSLRLKGGGGKQAQPARPHLTEIGKAAQSEVYGDITRGLGGGGALPQQTQDIARKYQVGGLTDAIDTGREELQSDMSRTVAKQDTRVKDYMMDTFDRSAATSVDDQRRGFQEQDFKDQEWAMAAGTDAIAGEKRMGVGILGMYNQGQANDYANLQANGSFGSNLMGGLVEGGMSAAYSNQYAKLMA